ncbi:cation-translocating P-type ATPase [Mycobacterium sp. M1]|uniref:Cation-translocating P-type ATPase n=1 Tax=Mycolicibacter acidiphilus TaxID=2835306 RepID=A0ABS5RID6_9MYCO|nr:cation-translocating P-type ATPase [Mycolicibacter acidiphilus]
MRIAVPALPNLIATGIRATADAVGSAAAAGIELAVMPVRAGALVLSGETSVSTLARKHWAGERRAWIEVRGLTGPDGAELGQAVVAALRDHPGVESVQLNRPLSRVVVEIDEGGPSLKALCAVLDGAEKNCRREPSEHRPDSLPGDGLLLALRGAMFGLNAAGLAVATAGRVLRIPAAPVAFDAVAAVASYQPWVRNLLQDRIGVVATDTVLSLVSLGAHVATLSVTSLSVDLALQGIKATEARSAALAWNRCEPVFARHAGQSDAPAPGRPTPAPEGPAERHGRRIAWVQLIGAGLVGAITRDVTMASTAAVTAAPKALRISREAFAATLSRGLADQHGVLPLRPAALRGLDKVDALLIDPRVLCEPTLRVVTVRGAGAAELPAAWADAQRLLDEPGLTPGWHRLAGRAEPVTALIAPVLHPLASALLVEARAADVELVSLDLPDTLGELRTAFDELRPVGAGVDDALAAALTELQQAGRTVAVLSAGADRALAGADLALGIMPAGDTAPPWHVDLLLDGLAGAWQVLRALPAAREATRRGITLSASASVLGGLLLVPGIRVRRANMPGPVTVGGAAGLCSGYLLARKVVRTPAPRPAPAHEWHAMSIAQVRQILPQPNLTARVSDAAATRPPNTAWQFVKAVRAELSDPMTPIMAVGSAATAILGSPIDAAMVGIVLVGNAMLAAGQQMRAESRLNVLLAQQTPPARTVTPGPDGTGYTEVPAELLAPGDVIEVRSNEVVPADARVIEATDLEVDESSLTGESLSVDKQTAPTPGAELAERSCMLYAGSTVIAGTAVAIVTAVGADTQTRRAAELAAGDLPTVGLQHQLSEVMYRAFPVSGAGGLLVGALGMLRGGQLRTALGDAIAIAVAAVPEGMPLMATLAQYASARRLTGTGALVRVPRAVEALGRLDVVCFDKTGTLSENRLRVTRVCPVDGRTDADVLHAALHAAPWAHGDAHAHATDQAIIEAGVDAAVPGPAAAPDVYLPFRSGRAFSAAVTGTELSVKGAPETVLAASGATDRQPQVDELAAAGLRVIAVGRRTLSPAEADAVRSDPDRITELAGHGLELTGLLGISDTPRPGAAKLLADLTDRGVGIRLISGDHPITVTAIAAELGLAVDADGVITGSEWDALSRREQERVACERVVFARMTPEHKVQIVQTLERAGKVSAMVGDGANDAAAIRVATVGVGVVARGSDSAHTVADVVLTDGRIGALTDAIDEGRRLWRGVQLAVSGLLGGNAGEVIFSVIGTAFTGMSPLNTRQLLLMNTLTDALPATAVAVSTPAGPVQRVAGGGLDERELWRAVAYRGAITATAATAAWAMAMSTGLTGLSALTGLGGGQQRAATVALISLVTTELGQTLVDSHAPLVLATAAGSFAVFALAVSTPGVSQLLGCTPIGPIGWLQALSTAGAATAAVAVLGRGRAARDDEPAADAPPAAHPPATAARTAADRAESAAAPVLRLVGRPEPQFPAYP